MMLHKYFFTLVILFLQTIVWAEERVPLPLPEPQVFLNPTIYYKPVMRFDSDLCEASERQDMKSPEGKSLVSLCPDEMRNCLMQGSCYVLDESGRFRSFNYYRRGSAGEALFKEIDTNGCPYGFGIRNICLDPYYSVAADLRYYRLGDVIFVPRLVGELMPDGLFHDGFLVVRDAGSAIKGPHRFDFYTGFTKPYIPENTFRRLGFSEVKNNFLYRMATEEEANRVRTKTGFPKTNRPIFIPPRD